MSKYIVTLTLDDDDPGRARRNVRDIAKRVIRDAWAKGVDDVRPPRDLYLRDIEVSEVVE